MHPPDGAQKRQVSLGYIDALRGYAILGVWIVHAGQFSLLISDWTVWGRYGVHLFFIVSAFTLSLSWQERPQTAATFFIRRFFRIAPMFWLAIVLFVFLNRIEQPPANQFTVLQIAATVFCLHGFHPVTNNLVVPGDWSIAVETMFYWIFPVLMFFVTSLKRSVVFVIVSLLLFRIGSAVKSVVLFWLFPDLPHALLTGYWWTSLPCNLVVFAIGIFAYWFVRSPAFAKISPRVAKVAFYASLVIAGAALINTQNTAIFFSLGSVLIFFSRNSQSLWNNRIARHLGKISFSGYLLHWLFGLPALAVAQQIFTNEWAVYFVSLGILCLLTTAAATITHLMIEKPFISLGRTICDRLATSAALDSNRASVNPRRA